MVTPWKFNIAPENVPSQKGSSRPTIIFQGRAVKLQGCIFPLSCYCRFPGCNLNLSGFQPPFVRLQVVAADEAVASEAAAEADGIKKAKTGMGMEG